MGIDGFNKAVKDLVPSAYGRISASELRGKRIAIDTSGIAYRVLCAGHKIAVNKTDVLVEPIKYEIRQDFYIDCMLKLLKKLLTQGITPVFVLEGTAPPDKVEHAHIRRRKQREGIRKRLADFEDKLKHMHVSDHTPELDKEYKKLLCQDVRPRQEEFVALEEILRTSGIPCIKAVGEAEKLCVALAIDGYVEAVYTKDTDVLPLGCQLMLTDHEETPRGLEFTCTRLTPILKGLDLSFEEFVDLCIMTQCDFNTRMRGYAFKKSYKLIKEYRSIDNLPDKFDITPLNHIRCRELFKITDSDCERSEDLCIDINSGALKIARDTLRMYGVENLVDQLLELYKTVPPASTRAYTVPPNSQNVTFVI